MARKNRFLEGYSVGFGPHFESGGSGSSGRNGTGIAASEDSMAHRQKWVDINSASQGGFNVPVEIVPLSKLSPSEKKSLVLRLRSDLERIRFLQKKFELQRINAVTVSSSSDILSGSNIKKGPQTLSTKKSSGQISRPGKKANSSGKKRDWYQGTSGRFESGTQGSVSHQNTLLLKQCSNLLKKLMTHEYGWVFNEPVDIVKLNIPDYFNVIKHPMDLGTIKQKLDSGAYSTASDFAADVRLTFSNAMTYNPPGNNVHFMAKKLNNIFDLKWKTIEKELSSNSSQTLHKSSGLIQETEVVKPSTAAKKRKLSPSEQVVSEPVKPRMTDEEKQKLSRELEGLDGDIPDNIIDLLKEQSSNGGEAGEDEIEIDIDDLSDDVLFALRKLLDEHLREKQKYNVIAEPCGIEVRVPFNMLDILKCSPLVCIIINCLCFSSLMNQGLAFHPCKWAKVVVLSLLFHAFVKDIFMHGCYHLKLCSLFIYISGNDPVDEDVDIGGNEPPVSSYPPVKIENDSGLSGNKYIANGRSDERLGQLLGQ